MMRFALITGLLLLASGGQARKTPLKLATLAPKNSVYHRALKKIAKAWKKDSGGKVRVRIYAGAVAGDDYDVIRKMRLGTLHGGLLTAGGFSTIDKSIHVLSVPTAMKNDADLDKVLAHFEERLNQAYEQRGFITLAWVDAGWARFLSKEPVKSPEDLSRLKLFVGAGQSEVAEIWKAIGFNPILLPTTEISTGLQTGLISALTTTPQAANLMQWYKHAPYLNSVKIAPLMFGFTLSKKSWEKLDGALQAKMKASAQEAMKELSAQLRPEDEASIKAMSKRGLKVLKVDAATMAQWEAVVEKAKPHIRGPYAPAELYDELLKLLEKSP